MPALMRGTDDCAVISDAGQHLGPWGGKLTTDELQQLILGSELLFHQEMASGQRIRTTMVEALKAACIVIDAQSDPVRS